MIIIDMNHDHHAGVQDGHHQDDHHFKHLSAGGGKVIILIIGSEKVSKWGIPLQAILQHDPLGSDDPGGVKELRCQGGVLDHSGQQR